MNLYERYEKLCQEPENATKLWYQKRGYEFEKLISDVLKRDGLFPHSSYKIKGEQIDGSFILGDRVYLLEAKWHKKEMTASDIYEFKGKVDDTDFLVYINAETGKEEDILVIVNTPNGTLTH